MKQTIKKILSILGMLSFIFVFSCTDPKNQEQQDEGNDMRNREEPGMLNDRDTTDQRMEDYDSDTTGM